MEYLIKSSAILGIFYIFYKLFLENETFFNSIRTYLIIGIVCSFTLPLISITKYIEIPTIQPSTITTSIEPVLNTPNEPINYIQILSFIYIAGVVVLSIKFLTNLFSLLWLISTEKEKKGRNERFSYIYTDKEINPFSFFNYIILNPKQFKKDELNQIIEHEKAHAIQMHSLDLLLTHMIQIVFWFNPFSWLYQKEVQKNLEFLADGQAVKQLKEKKNYQYLLLRTAVSKTQIPLTSDFYNSLIKKRIKMLEKNKSKNTSQFKFVLIIPVLILFVSYFNTSVIAQNTTKKIEWIADQEIEIITKDFSKNQLETLKVKLADQGINFRYKKLKYNSSNEIISISIAIKNDKNQQSNLSLNGTNPIQPIKIQFSEDGTLAVGNFSDELHFAPKSQNVWIEKKGEGENVFIIKSDSTTFDSKNGKAIFITGYGDQNTTMKSNPTWINKNGDTIKISDKNHFTQSPEHIWVEKKGDGDHTNVWVSKSGDTSKVKNINVIRISDKDGNDLKEKVIIKSFDDKVKDENVIILDEKKEHQDKVIFMSSDAEGKPLIIIDGKEANDKKIDDIDPDQIESINVIKGEAAIKKYGDKGKNGVIEITKK